MRESQDRVATMPSVFGGSTLTGTEIGVDAFHPWHDAAGT
jgi:hypothetical protein